MLGLNLVGDPSNVSEEALMEHDFEEVMLEGGGEKKASEGVW